MNNLGTRIKEIRESKNISLYELSRITGISNCHLWRMENNKRKDPAISTVVKVANALDVSVEDIIGQYRDEPIKINTIGIVDSKIIIDNCMINSIQKKRLYEFLIDI